MYKERLEICKGCDKLEIYLDKIYRCSECKCVLNIKARMKSQKCPLDKWGRENNNSSVENCNGC